MADERLTGVPPGAALDLEPFKVLARTHRMPRDPFAEELSAAIFTLCREIEAVRAAQQTTPELHRCVACGHRWDGPLKGAELCGDCWRAAWNRRAALDARRPEQEPDPGRAREE